MGGYLLTRGEGDDVRRSVDFSRRAIAADPGYARAYSGLGNAYLLLSRRDEGMEALRRSLELDPDLWPAHLRLALQLAYVDDRLDAAGPHFRRALELDPVSPRVNGDVGRLYYLAGRHEEPVAQCRRTRELIPDALRPGDCQVQALVEKGALEEAHRVRCPVFPQMPLDPALAPLRSDPRFTALLRRMGLSPSRGRLVTSRSGD